MANYGGAGGGTGSALRRSLLGPQPQRPIANGINWGGEQFADPGSLVAWMNARGAGTSVDQFLGNHPGVASRFGQRHAAPYGSEGPPNGLTAQRPIDDAGLSQIPEGSIPGLGSASGVAQVNAGMPPHFPHASGVGRGLMQQLQRASLGQVSQRRLARRAGL